MTLAVSIEVPDEEKSWCNDPPDISKVRSIPNIDELMHSVWYNILVFYTYKLDDESFQKPEHLPNIISLWCGCQTYLKSWNETVCLTTELSDHDVSHFELCEALDLYSQDLGNKLDAYFNNLKSLDSFLETRKEVLDLVRVETARYALAQLEDRRKVKLQIRRVDLGIAMEIALIRLSNLDFHKPSAMMDIIRFLHPLIESAVASYAQQCS